MKIQSVSQKEKQQKEKELNTEKMGMKMQKGGEQQKSLIPGVHKLGHDLKNNEKLTYELP